MQALHSLGRPRLNSYEVELQAAIGFLADQIQDLHTLIRSTPPDVLGGQLCQSLMLQAIDVMATGSGVVIAHKVLTEKKAG